MAIPVMTLDMHLAVGCIRYSSSSSVAKVCMVPRSLAQNQDHSELTNKPKQYQQCKSETVLIWQFDKLVNLIRMSWQPGGQRREICSQFWGFDSALISLWSRLCQAVWRPSIGHKGREHRAKLQDSEYSQVVKKRLEEPGTGILQSLLSSFVCPLHQDLALLHPNFQMTCCECFDQVYYFYNTLIGSIDLFPTVLQIDVVASALGWWFRVCKATCLQLKRSWTFESLDSNKRDFMPLISFDLVEQRHAQQMEKWKNPLFLRVFQTIWSNF